jgi:hypothetical protein
MDTGPAAIKETLGDRLAWTVDHPSAAILHERGREAGYSAGHAAAVHLELGTRGHEARTIENKASRFNPERAVERLSGLLRARYEWGARRAKPRTIDPNIGSDRPLFDAYLPQREAAGAGLR